MCPVSPPPSPGGFPGLLWCGGFGRQSLAPRAGRTSAGIRFSPKIRVLQCPSSTGLCGGERCWVDLPGVAAWAKSISPAVFPPHSRSRSCCQSQTRSFWVDEMQVVGIVANTPTRAESASLARKSGLILGVAVGRFTFPLMLLSKPPLVRAGSGPYLYTRVFFQT